MIGITIVVYLTPCTKITLPFAKIILTPMLNFLQIYKARLLIAMKVKNLKTLAVLHKVLINDFEYDDVSTEACT